MNDRFYIENMTAKKIGERDESFIRGKKFRLDNDVDEETVIDLINGTGTGSISKTLILDASDEVEITNGWNEERWQITVTVLEKVGMKERIHVLTAFTEHRELFKRKNERYVFNPSIMLNLTRINEFKVTDAGLVPTASYVVNTSENIGIMSTDQNHLLNKFATRGMNITLDSRDDMSLTPTLLPAHELYGDSSVENLLTNFSQGLRQGNMDLQRGLAVSALETSNALTANPFISLINTENAFGSGLNSQTSIPFYIFKKYTDSSTHFDIDDALFNAKEVRLKGEQSYLDSNVLHNKLAIQINEKVAILLSNNLMSTISLTTSTRVPTAQNGYSEVMSVFNKLEDYIVPGIRSGVKARLLEKTINEIEAMLDDLIEYDFIVHITVYDMVYTEISVSLNGSRAKTSTHSTFAGSIINSLLSTKSGFKENMNSVLPAIKMAEDIILNERKLNASSKSIMMNKKRKPNIDFVSGNQSRKIGSPRKSFIMS